MAWTCTVPRAENINAIPNNIPKKFLNYIQLPELFWKSNSIFLEHCKKDIVKALKSKYDPVSVYRCKLLHRHPAEKTQLLAMTLLTGWDKSIDVSWLLTNSVQM